MNDLIKNNLKAVLNFFAVIVIAVLFVFSYRYEVSSLNSVSVAFEKQFKVFDGFTFRVTNNSELDFNSVKMTVNSKGDPAADFVCYPRRALYRNGFTLHDTSDFVNSKGEYFKPAKGDKLDILIECRGADGRFYRASGVVEYK